MHFYIKRYKLKSSSSLMSLEGTIKDNSFISSKEVDRQLDLALGPRYIPKELYGLYLDIKEYLQRNK